MLHCWIRLLLILINTITTVRPSTSGQGEGEKHVHRVVFVVSARNPAWSKDETVTEEAE